MQKLKENFIPYVVLPASIILALVLLNIEHKMDSIDTTVCNAKYGVCYEL